MESGTKSLHLEQPVQSTEELFVDRLAEILLEQLLAGTQEQSRKHRSSASPVEQKPAEA